MLLKKEQAWGFSFINPKCLILMTFVISGLILGCIFLHHRSQTQKYKTVTLQVDKTAPLPQRDFVREISEQFWNVPILQWEKYKNTRSKMYFENNTCAPYPSIFDLEFDSTYWQAMYTRNGSFFLYGAYYDSRNNTSLPSPSVRILSMINRNEPSTLHCQLWFEDKDQPIIVETIRYYYIWYKGWGGHSDGIMQPYLITCPIPASSGDSVPISVSLVWNACDSAKNHLSVFYNKPIKKDSFVVCVKGLNFLHVDLSIRLIEWLEILYILGADKVFFYQFQTHPNIAKVLNYYENLNKVVVTPLTLPGGKPNLSVFQKRYLSTQIMQKRLNEVIPYNDCLYRNLYAHDYVILLDIDEIIVPVEDNNWVELLGRIKSELLSTEKTYASFNARNVYFFDDMEYNGEEVQDIPPYMHILRHVVRSQKFTAPFSYVKSFFSTDQVITLHNHLPIAFFPQVRSSFSINTSYAKMQHYRKDCVAELKCEPYRNATIVDTSVLRHKVKIISGVEEILNKLNLT